MHLQKISGKQVGRATREEVTPRLVFTAPSRFAGIIQQGESCHLAIGRGPRRRRFYFSHNAAHSIVYSASVLRDTDWIGYSSGGTSGTPVVDRDQLVRRRREPGVKEQSRLGRNPALRPFGKRSHQPRSIGLPRKSAADLNVRGTQDPGERKRAMEIRGVHQRIDTKARRDGKYAVI